MTEATRAQAAAEAAIAKRLAFQQDLQAVTNQIHAAADVDEIMLEVSEAICVLFAAERLTIYKTSTDGQALESRVKTGLQGFRGLRLPISTQSVAGFVALTGRTLNLTDVYNHEELHGYHPDLRFLIEVDKRTGFRTREMLVAAVRDPKSLVCMGVVQLINNRVGGPFDELAVEGLVQLTQTLAIAFHQRESAHVMRHKYDGLVLQSALTAADLDYAT